ncbi:OPT family oligopeptide transporter [Neisseriaceae bacterium CLB008]
MKPSTAHPAADQLKELTLRGMILGALITVIFTASNVYLGLKVGLTFASSIPAAVISIAVLRMFAHSNILENNMVQTQASAAGTLSSIIFVLPGLLMLGYWQDFPFWQTAIICAAGGILGVVFTVPLRQVMVVKSTLPYPEGVAAAEILKAGHINDHKTDAEKVTPSKSEGGMRDIVEGGLIAAFVSLCTAGFRILSDSASYWFTTGKAIFQVPMGFSVALVGAGYLVGIVGGMAMLVGILISWGVAVPYLTTVYPMPEGTTLAAYAQTIWATKVRFIGAGTMAVAAVWTLMTLAKPIIEGVMISMRAIKKGSDGAALVDRTEQDLSPKWLVLITATIVVILLATFYSFVMAAPISAGLAWTLVIVTTLMSVLIGFLVASACGYMAGLIGSSSSPISGIGIISIILISIVLLLIGESSGLLATPEGTQFLTALAIFTTSVVLAIATISNDNLQDLKTGFLLQATPWRQQVALIIGCIVGALVISPVLELLYHAYGFTGAMPRPGMDASQALAAPQATLMTQISTGIFSHNLEWSYIVTGMIIAVVLIVIDTVLKKSTRGRFTIPVLAVGMGIYLPASVNMPLIVGAVLSWLVARRIKAKAARDNVPAEPLLKASDGRATLFAAGLIVGESIIGVVLAMIIVVSVTSGGSDAPLAIMPDSLAGWSQTLGLIAFVLVLLRFGRRALK